MALWKDDHGEKTFDDGLQVKPGEAGFSRELASQHFGHENFSYMGTPNWQAPVEEPAVEAQPVDEQPPADKPAEPEGESA